MMIGVVKSPQQRTDYSHCMKNRESDLMKQLLAFLNRLEENKIYYQLEKVRCDAIMVKIAVAGQRWEVEFMEDGTIEIEKFLSAGDYYDSQEIENLFEDFSD